MGGRTLPYVRYISGHAMNNQKFSPWKIASLGKGTFFGASIRLENQLGCCLVWGEVFSVLRTLSDDLQSM